MWSDHSDILIEYYQMSSNVRNYTFGHVRPAFAQSDQSLLGVFWIGKIAKCLQADKEDSDQTSRKRRLI